MAPALNYGVQAYEGMKAFRLPGDSAISIFRPDRNAARLQHSADVVSIPRVPEALFLQGVRAAVALNAEYVPPHETGAAMYIRPQIFGSSAQLGLSPPEDYLFCVYVMPTGTYHGSHPVKALVLDEFDRAAPNGTGNAKVGGNYGPVLRWSDKARADGFGITLHLDSARHEEIDEFSTSGFIGAIVDGEDVTLVVPDSKAVIDSVTSESVQHIARSFGWTVEKRVIKYAELPAFSEVFAAGTAAALVPIRSVTRRGTSGLPDGAKVTRAEGAETVTYLKEGQGEPGPLFGKLLSHLKGIQAGKIEEDFGWRAVLNEKDTNVASQVNGNGAKTVDELV